MNDPVGPRVESGPGVVGDGINVPIPGGLDFGAWDAPTWAANVRGAFAGGPGAGGPGGLFQETGQAGVTGGATRRRVRTLRRTSSEPPNPNPRYEPEAQQEQQSPSFGRTPEREEDPRPGQRWRFD